MLFVLFVLFVLMIVVMISLVANVAQNNDNEIYLKMKLESDEENKRKK